MDILVLPISGGGFISQVAGICQICEHGYKPDIILSASGGNVAAYIAMGSGYDRDRMVANLGTISSSTYIGNPNILSIGYNLCFHSSLFNIPKPEFCFDDMFPNRETITRTEIWTGTTNISTYRATLSCNRSLEHSILSLMPNESYDISYLCGDIMRIKDVFNASASIPLMVRKVDIDDSPCMDGGLGSASPLSFAADRLKDMSSFHVIYITGTDIYYPNKCNSDSVVGRALCATSSMIYNNIVRDRNTALLLLGKHKSQYLDADRWYNEYSSIRSTYDKTVLELCTSSKDINLLSFTKEDNLNKFNRCRESIKYRIYYS